LPEAEAREVAMHLESCAACSALVASLQRESRMLVQCLQDVDLAEEAVPEFHAAPEPIGIGRFALGVLGIAVAFRLSVGILFGLELPPGLEWLDPREWVLSAGVGVNTVIYAIQSGSVALSNAIQTAAIISLGGLVLAGMARALKRTAAIGAMLSVILAFGVFSPSGYAIDLRKGAAASLPVGETVDDTLMASAGEGGKNVNIAGTVKGDLIAGGDTITISGTVEGNVLAFGRRVDITGTIGGNLITAAQNVTITGKVSGSILGAASVIDLSGEVGRNLAAFGGNVNLSKTAQIGGNVASYGGESVVEGNIQRDLYSGEGVLDLRGSARNVDFRGGQASLAASARVGGNFFAQVQDEKKVNIDPAAMIAGSKHIELTPERPSKYRGSGYYFWQIVRLIAGFITGLIVFRLAPWLAPTRVASGTDWLKAGGLGFVALVTIPIAAIIVACTVIGLPLALSSIVLWLAGLYMAKIIVAEFVGRILFKKSNAVSLLAGLALVLVVVDLPILGGVMGFVFYLLGLGAIVMTVYRMKSGTPALAMT